MTTINNERLWMRLVRASETRVSRFHDEKGQFAFRSVSDLVDFFKSDFTYLLKTFGFRPCIPWITFRALRFVRKQIRTSWKVFEWGSGMSTLWWESRVSEVHSVEHNKEWARRVDAMSRGKANIRLCADRLEYTQAITAFPLHYFDAIVIDGIERLGCFNTALRHLKPGGLLILDNTDMDRITKGDLYKIDIEIENNKSLAIHRFPGWVPARLSPQETSVCIYDPPAAGVQLTKT